jgi:CubicO group peptidase (beta-lactamase class C family)
MLLKLIDQGEVALEDKVVDYIPQFGGSERRDAVKIKHLLTYTVDIFVSPEKYFGSVPVNEVLKNIMKAPLQSPPGESFRYTKVTTILTGMIVEDVTEKRLDENSRDTFFDPLGMNQTTFHPNRDLSAKIPPTENKKSRGLIQGEVHDEDTHKLQSAGHYYGPAGLFSSVPDLLQFLEMMLNDGRKDGDKYLSESMLNNALSPHFPGPKYTIGLGWALDDQKHVGESPAGPVFSYVGFTGCLFAGNQSTDSGAVILSNRTYPKRPEEPTKINKFRRDIASLVWEFTAN